MSKKKESYKNEIEQDSKKEAIFIKERNDFIKKELIKLFEFGTDLNKNYDLLKEEA